MTDQPHHTIATTPPPATTQGQGRLLLSSQAAEMLGVSPRHIQMQASAGLIPFGETEGGHRRIALEDVITAVHASGITAFTASDKLVRLSVAAGMCGVPPARFRRAAEEIGAQLGRTIGAQEGRGHLRVMQSQIDRVRQHLLSPRGSAAC